MEQVAVHRTGGPGCPDDVPAAKRVIDDVVPTVFAHALHLVLDDLCASALQQKLVELVAANRMLPGPGRETQKLPVKPECLEGHETVRVVARVQFEVAQRFRCDPARAELRPRERRLVEHDYVEAGLT